ncbi:unnamed protein product [Paramecium octaurelia]|uniref:Uncharacterized protein n=1 Tax=Paramecium octaurelia TaxID=43137 RepID=A0A8S1YDH0_PAROT|nr:unnamed protein product [Paramecium octaurelia]
MKQQTQCITICQQSKNNKQSNREYQVNSLNEITYLLSKTKIEIQYTDDNKIIYSQDEVILREEQNLDNLHIPEIFINIEQVRYLQWEGEYSQNQKKIGKWFNKWNGEALEEVGGYYQNGEKKGLWKEIFKNYWSQAQVLEIGEYVDNQKIGIWKYQYHEKTIGGGSYNRKGQKNGKWIDLSDEFWDHSQVTNNQWIGGGSYDEGGSGIKIGKWVELSERFTNSSKITFIGEYKKDKKVGKWDIFLRELEMQNYRGNEFIVVVDSMKKKVMRLRLEYGLNNARIIEKHQRLFIMEFINLVIGLEDGIYIFVVSRQVYSSQITYIGQYENGKKIGRWDIVDMGSNVGGGSYDDEWNGIKLGRWIELSNNFGNGIKQSKITYAGDYKYGKKIGRWDIKHDGKDIGGGSYDERGDEIKIGRWVELSNTYGNGIKQSKITYTGKYKQGKKVGRWNIQNNGKDMQKRNQQIFSGGGSYNEEGYEIKIGRWVELWKLFYMYQQVIWDGEYNYGKKVGRWDLLYKEKSYEQFQKIGGGFYDERNNADKIGNWIELSDNFSDMSQLTYNGEYKNGKKCGRWEIYYRKQGKYQQIGGGHYNNEGNQGTKNGKWAEVKDEFSDWNQYICKGEYQNGKKIGTWEDEDIGEDFKHIEII